MASTKVSRFPSASEIANNTTLFARWSAHQRLLSATMEDVPHNLRHIVDQVLDVSGALPLSLVQKTSKPYRGLKMVVPEVLDWLQAAHTQNPSLFSANAPLTKNLVTDLCLVFTAWQRHNRMAGSTVKWTEADRASQVYSLVRTAGIRKGRLRLQSRISLPHPLQKETDALDHGAVEQPADVLRAKVVIPDATVFVAWRHLQGLVQRQSSAYNKLQLHDGARFAANATPSVQLPERPKFEFASSVWEDKKPDQHDVEHAYRQNRMATTALVRHLQAFRIPVPVFGMIWAEGTVRLHVDWAGDDNLDRPSVVSARYSPPTSDDRRESGASGMSTAPEFAVLDLSKPADIIAAFVHVRNIDGWTFGGFQDKVVTGVETLTAAISRGEAQFSPWKMRTSQLPATVSAPAAQSGIEPKIESDETAGPKAVSTLPRRSARTIRKQKVVTRSPPEENTTTKKKVGKKPKVAANSASAATTSSGRMVLRARK